jgi:thiosulfate dehydrogenase
MCRFALGFVVGVLALPSALLTAARIGLFPVTSKAAPSRIEAALAHMALDFSAARRAPQLANPIAPTEENLLAGVKLFKGDCAGCHGTPSSAQENEKNMILYPNAPQFALHPPTKPDYQLFWIISGGVRYSGMFAFGGQFAPDANGKDVSDQKIWTAVTFITHLNSLPPSVEAEWHRKSDN